MPNKPIENNQEIEIDLRRLFGALLHRAWVIILAAVLGGVISFLGTRFLITPEYQSSAMFYVNNNAISVGDVSLSSITSSDITASKNLVNSYIVILQTRTTLNDVIDYAGVNRTFTEVKNMLTAASVSDTEIFRVTVTSTDPQEAEKIANAIAYILPKRISSIIEGTSAKIVDSAVVASVPSAPSYPKNVMIGMMLGFMLAAGVIILKAIFDITVRTEDDITQTTSHPILTSVPDMAAPSKGGYYYVYGDDKKKKKKSRQKSKNGHRDPVLVGNDISFSASEAYKLLRTKLQFSFADENNCRVIGLSSAMAGEGKSLSSINLAHSLSQLNKKVLLIDCDMRRPSLSAKLPIKQMPGLSAGRIPPNPIELLSSAKMERLLASLREVYDYVILDFPPVGEVSDAMAVAKQTDGMLLVVRQNYCNRMVLNDLIRQFEFVEARILGIVYNCTSTENSGYGYNKKYYKKYYKKYKGGYYSPYANSSRVEEKDDVSESADDADTITVYTGPDIPSQRSSRKRGEAKKKVMTGDEEE